MEEAAQTAPVVDDSVVAVVLQAHDQGDEFALDLAERCGAGHGRFVQALVCGHAAGIQRVHGEDVVDPPVGGIDHPRMKLTERAVPGVVGNDLDTCSRHGPAFHTSRGIGVRALLAGAGVAAPRLEGEVFIPVQFGA